MISAFANTWKIPELRDRILFTLALIVIIRLGVHITLPGVDANVIKLFLKDLQSKGADNPAGGISALLNVFAGSPFFHSGSARTLEEVLENVQHRSLGTTVDTLSNAADRAKAAKFLASIDATTVPFPERTMNEARTLCLP